MKLIELRKDGHSAYVKKSQLSFMLRDGWSFPSVKVYNTAKGKGLI